MQMKNCVNCSNNKECLLELYENFKKSKSIKDYININPNIECKKFNFNDDDFIRVDIEVKAQHEDDMIICPYCGYIIVNDGSILEYDGDDILICDKCNNSLTLNVEVIYLHYTYKRS